MVAPPVFFHRAAPDRFVHSETGVEYRTARPGLWVVWVPDGQGGQKFTRSYLDREEARQAAIDYIVEVIQPRSLG